ncbi:MAG: MotA/TolQ/ExbB proton channel family protein [Hyphomicrobium sp.]
MLIFAADTSAHGFTVWGLIQQADPVVKSVMGGLVLASVVCWAIILEKIYRLRRLSSDVKKLEAIAAGGGSVISTGLPGHLLTAARIEAEEGFERGEGRTDVRARLERAMRGALKSDLQRQEAGLPFLATIGSSAPFVGLFGTVWGIMNSFTAISQQQDTSLATVAPGIAEALFATALGLAAAIPAVMAYNAIAVSLGRYAARAGSAITGLARNMSLPHNDVAAKANVEPLRAGKIM